MDDVLATLRDLYDRLDATLPAVAGNPCGTCKACCTARGLTYHRVQQVEVAHLEGIYGAEAAARFLEFAERRKDADGAFLHEVCPFYDRGRGGCGIYGNRPYACRLFGHFRMAKTALPDPCVFEGRDTEVPAGEYFQRIPLADRMRAVERRYVSLLPPRTGGEAPPPVAADLIAQARANANPGDLFDMAVVAHLEGSRDEALRLFDEALAARPDATYAHFYRGNLLQELGRAGEAAASYQEALRIEPDNPRFLLHLAFSLLDVRDPAGAMDAFARVADLSPEDSTARGFLGYLRLLEGDADGAARHLSEAVEREPGNAFFQLRLGDALCRLGQPEAARRHLEAARANPRTAGEAEALLGRDLPVAPEPPPFDRVADATLKGTADAH